MHCKPNKTPNPTHYILYTENERKSSFDLLSRYFTITIFRVFVDDGRLFHNGDGILSQKSFPPLKNAHPRARLHSETLVFWGPARLTGDGQRQHGRFSQHVRSRWARRWCEFYRFMVVVVVFCGLRKCYMDQKNYRLFLARKWMDGLFIYKEDGNMWIGGCYCTILLELCDFIVRTLFVV